jgi:hypothetical protein
MAELKPLAPIQGIQVQEKKEAEKPVIEQPTEKVESPNDLLKKVNGELCFELILANGKLLVSTDKCVRLIPKFKTMTTEQRETFLIQAAIFGANPFSVPAEIYPVPFKLDGKDEIIPIISYKKYVEKGMENQRFDGSKSGVVVEKKDGRIEYIRGQAHSLQDTLIGGWCEVFLKGMKETIFRSIMLNEFIKTDSNGVATKFYKEKPSVMCEKIAKKNAFEDASLCPKAYIEEEIALDIEHEDLSQQKAITASNDEFFNK